MINGYLVERYSEAWIAYRSEFIPEFIRKISYKMCRWHCIRTLVFVFYSIGFNSCHFLDFENQVISKLAIGSTIKLDPTFFCHVPIILHKDFLLANLGCPRFSLNKIPTPQSIISPSQDSFWCDWYRSQDSHCYWGLILLVLIKEMVQRLRTMTILLEDLGSIPSTHVAAHNCL